jgi:hypothetical protein
VAIYLVVFSALLAFDTVNIQGRFYIKFVQSGGFAGLTSTIELAGDTLSSDEQKILLQLLKDSNFFDQDFKSAAENSPDQYNYEITVAVDKTKRTININDAEVTDGLRPLIRYLSGKARAYRK